jgi:hypothetical protein
LIRQPEQLLGRDRLRAAGALELQEAALAPLTKRNRSEAPLQEALWQNRISSSFRHFSAFFQYKVDAKKKCLVLAARGMGFTRMTSLEVSNRRIDNLPPVV